jgi:hypothetical protein
MKSLSIDLSTQQLSHHDGRALRAPRRFPQTDHHYQATASSLASRAVPASYAAQMRSFRQLSNTATGAEARWQFAVEATVFGLIVATVAWPLISLLIVLAQTARG